MPAESERAVFVISVAAELAGVHPQTLRIYEREGLVQPKRTTANARRYSQRDIERLLEIKRLTGDGMNLEGVRRVMALTQEVERLQAALAALEGELRAQARRHRQELEKVRRSARRDLVPYSSAIVRYEHPSRYEQA
ncbi:MAG TPA: MerR family transcriptional regulator [Actinomycetota bacterium]|jgi:MerR family transcriptional regulator/heat shock protein HspR|nr:MerR family transcriptional regulator [Actinomycetota bacterium]